MLEVLERASGYTLFLENMRKGKYFLYLLACFPKFQQICINWISGMNLIKSQVSYSVRESVTTCNTPRASHSLGSQECPQTAVKWPLQLYRLFSPNHSWQFMQNKYITIWKKMYPIIFKCRLILNWNISSCKFFSLQKWRHNLSFFFYYLSNLLLQLIQWF